MSFDDAAQGKPDQEMELKMDTEAKIDYPLSSIKFSNVYNLTLHIPRSFGGEQTRIYYVSVEIFRIFYPLIAFRLASAAPSKARFEKR